MTRVEPPSTIAPRAWALGVAAVQVWVEEGRVLARLRRNVTGSVAVVVPLPQRALVDVGLAVVPPPRAFVLPDDDAAARLALFVDGEPVADAVLPRDRLRDDPAPRAYGHVFCRWLRDGGHELGCDLTGFESRAEGEKVERLVVRALSPGQSVSYALVIG